MMKALLLAGVSLVAIGSIDGAVAADATLPSKAPANCAGGTVDPYKNYSCLDTYLGSDFFTRFINYYGWNGGTKPRPPIPRRLRDAATHGRRRRKAFRRCRSANGRMAAPPASA
jgi:hypothetical protein